MAVQPAGVVYNTKIRKMPDQKGVEWLVRMRVINRLSDYRVIFNEWKYDQLYKLSRKLPCPFKTVEHRRNKKEEYRQAYKRGDNGFKLFSVKKINDKKRRC